MFIDFDGCIRLFSQLLSFDITKFLLKYNWSIFTTAHVVKQIEAKASLPDRQITIVFLCTPKNKPVNTDYRIVCFYDVSKSKLYSLFLRKKLSEFYLLYRIFFQIKFIEIQTHTPVVYHCHN